MLLLGHRGARRYAPENTLAAFDLALAHGCDGFEFDVRLTADRRAVICHDRSLSRLPVAGSTYAGLMARCPTLTTLEEVLQRFVARAYLYIELKVPGSEEQLLAALAAYPPQRGYVVASFLPDVLTGIARLNAAIPLGFIFDSGSERQRWRDLPVTAVMPKHTLASAALVQAVHAAGKQVFAWTVNQRGQMQLLAALGIDGIVADDTRLLGHTLGRL